MKPLLLLLLLVGSLPAATTFSGTGVSADINVSDQHTLAVTITGTFVATIVLEQAVSGGYVPYQTWTAGVTYKPPALTGVWRLRCSDYTSGTATYTLTSVANNQVIYRKPNGSTAFSVDVDGLVTSAGGAITGGTIDNTPIGGTTAAAGAFTTVSATGQITSTLATGTAPLSIASTTNVPNLNASSLSGATFAAPGAIGGGTPGSAAHTTLTANGATTLTAGTASTSTTTGTLVVTGGAGFSDAINVTAASRFGASGTAGALVHLKQLSDGSTGGLKFERNGSTDTQALFMQGSLGSLQDVLTFYTSFAGAAEFAVDRSGLVYVGGKLLIGSTTDDTTNALQVTGTGKFTGTTDSTTAATGAIIDAGGLGVAKNIVGKQGLGVGVTSTPTAAANTTLTSASTACQVWTGTTTQTMTLPAANAFGAGIAYVVYVKNLSTGVVTVSRGGSDTINSTASNVTTFTLAQWASATLYSDGVSAWERF